MTTDPPAGTVPADGDPVASRTGWEPLVVGGTNFRTRNLVHLSPDRLEFPASVGMKLFAGLFGVVGLVLLVIGAHTRDWVPLLVGAVFLGVGLLMFRTGTTPVVFDRRQDAFWKGRRAPSEVIRRADLEHYTPLSEIHALQVLAEYVRGNKRSYCSYELNLVLRDGKRLNVMDHGDYDALRRDAATLAEFLGRPLWDAVPEQRDRNLGG